MEQKSKMQYKHIFFDLDHTLWDFDKNAEETLHELYQSHQLRSLGVSCPYTFIETYTRNNHALWASYHTGKISKEYLRTTRFRKTFIDLGVKPDAIPSLFEEDYVRICPTKTGLFPGTHDILQYLNRRYRLHIISNGFTEATTTKIKVCELAGYFTTIVISEKVGSNKPDKAIFEYALREARAEKNECIMIGDSLEADVRGALDYGIDAIYFNPADKPKPEDVPVQIKNLDELRSLL
ncbi:noncanonical pyrimidine nucleotidase, YjjG family [Pararcticibacter amylolyticus]|uniref:Noncanonical pyrimidine nucleotidase, YjjG family n=2 Tax=Pararcticibacter amylolyticus TaxID=2173175 RepID=A0A2U2PLP0_9SPHI|nr:noncanonical pyrimidine nucleotidase, YjjG family [Pararcticibacter amylolyticus]